MFEEAIDQVPPPSYQISQEDFEQKTSHAVSASLALVPSTVVEEEDWEVWDEAVFEAAARNLGAAPSSSSCPPPPPQRPPEKHPFIEEPAVRPLKVVKKLKAFPFQSNPPSRAGVPNTYHQPSTAGPQHVIPQSDTYWNTPADDLNSLSRSMSIMSTRRTPPPEFDPVGPSLDGPPYEENQGEVVCRYEPEGSRAASPLEDPVASFRPSRSQIFGPGSRATSVSPAPSQRQAISNSQHLPQFNKFRSPRRTVNAHISKFDPLSAYSHTSSQPMRYADTSPKVNSSAFYASAVSAHLPKAAQSTPFSNYQPTIRRQNVSQRETTYGDPYHDSFSEGHRTRAPSISSSSMSSESSQSFINQQPLVPNRSTDGSVLRPMRSLQPNR